MGNIRENRVLSTPELPGHVGLSVQARHCGGPRGISQQSSPWAARRVWICQNRDGTGVLWTGMVQAGSAGLLAMPSPSVEMQEIGLQLAQPPGYTGEADIHAGSCRLRLPDGDLLSSCFFNENFL